MFEFNLLLMAIDSVSGVDKKTLKSKNRRRELVELRVICCGIIKAHNNYLGANKIAELLDLNHASITHYNKLNKNLMLNKDGKYKSLYEKIDKVYCSYVARSYDYIDSLVERNSVLK